MEGVGGREGFICAGLCKKQKKLWKIDLFCLCVCPAELASPACCKKQAAVDQGRRQSES